MRSSGSAKDEQADTLANALKDNIGLQPQNQYSNDEIQTLIEALDAFHYDTSSDEQENDLEGTIIPVTAIDGTKHSFEILEDMSGTAAGCFRVRSKCDGDTEKKLLFNEGKRFVLKVFAPELASGLPYTYQYTLTAELKNELETMLQDGRFQAFVNSLQEEIDDKDIPQEILDQVESRPIRKIDVLVTCLSDYPAQKGSVPPLLQKALDVRLITISETLPIWRYALAIHVSCCTALKEMAVHEFVGPLVKAYVPEFFGLFKQHLWSTPTNTLALDCVAMEELKGCTLRTLISHSDSLDEKNEELTHILSTLLCPTHGNIQKAYRSAREMLSILRSIGLVHADLHTFGNIFVRMNRQHTLVNFCLVDLCSIKPSAFDAQAVKNFYSFLDKFFKQPNICPPSYIQFSSSSFGYLLTPCKENVGAEDNILFIVEYLFRNASADIIALNKDELWIKTFPRLNSRRNRVGWSTLMLAMEKDLPLPQQHVWQRMICSIMMKYGARSTETDLQWFRLTLEEIEHFCRETLKISVPCSFFDVCQTYEETAPEVESYTEVKLQQLSFSMVRRHRPFHPLNVLTKEYTPEALEAVIYDYLKRGSA